MIGELIPGEILPGDAGTGDGGGGGSSFISAGSLLVLGGVRSVPVFPVFSLKFGQLERTPVAVTNSVKLLKFGPVYPLGNGVSRLRGLPLLKFSMAGVLPSYNPIRENWVRQLRGFKLLKFGG